MGHVLSGDGVATDPEKLVAVQDWSVPQSVREVKAFLGTVGYYHHCVEDFAKVAHPLTNLTGKSVP